MEQASRDYVNSLARGLEVIRAFTRSKPSMTLSQVAERTDMNRAAARRFLLTLVREGYAETDGKYFRLKPKVLELGFSVLASMDITEVMQPVMNELADAIGESCFGVVLDGDSCVYVARAASRQVFNVGISIGSRAPAHCMSSGRVLLAALSDGEVDAYLQSVKLEKFTPNTITSKVKLRGMIEDARRQGYAIVDQEFEVGLRSVSVPILDRARKVVAALNITCPTPRIAPEKIRTHILPKLQAAAERISMSLPE
jgi:IclR family pca regulon transcriptional regulator